MGEIDKKTLTTDQPTEEKMDSQLKSENGDDILSLLSEDDDEKEGPTR